MIVITYGSDIVKNTYDTLAASDISTYGRATQGVRLMRTTSDSRVISIARTEKEDELLEISD